MCFSFLRRSLDFLPGLLSLFPLVTNFPSPRSNSRSRLLELTSGPGLHRQLRLVLGSWRNSFGLGDLGFPLFHAEESPITGPLPVMKPSLEGVRRSHNCPVARLPSCLLGTTRISRQSNSSHQIFRSLQMSPPSVLSFPLPALRPSLYQFCPGILGAGWGGAGSLRRERSFQVRLLN